MLAFVLYVGYFLWLTAMNENETKVLSRMQDIIIKTSGWGLFVLSYFRNGNKKKDED